MKRAMLGVLLIALAVVVYADVPNDPLFPQQWGLQGGYGSNAAAVWAAGHTGCENPPLLGVMGTGVYHQHVDLAANIRTDLSWNFITNSTEVYDNHVSKGNDEDAHETNTAGTIAAVGNNGIGVAGGLWCAQLVVEKVTTIGGQVSVTNYIQGLDRLTNLRLSGVPIVAVNMSFILTISKAENLSDAAAATARAWNAGIVLVAAAGSNNQNTDISPLYPAGFQNVLSVTSLLQDGSRQTQCAAYGPLTVHLGAPGGNIYTTFPNDAYGSRDCTSMAAPHVTAAAGLYASIHPTATALEIRQAILDSALATPTASLLGITATGGRLNMACFVGACGSVPPPTTTTTTTTTVPPVPPPVGTTQPVVALVSSHEGGGLLWGMAQSQDIINEAAAVFGPSSYGAYSLTATTYGPFTVPASLACPDASHISSQAADTYGQAVEALALAAGVPFPCGVNVWQITDCGHSEQTYASRIQCGQPRGVLSDGKTITTLHAINLGLPVAGAQVLPNPPVDPANDPNVDAFDPLTLNGWVGFHAPQLYAWGRQIKGWLPSNLIRIDSPFNGLSNATLTIEMLETPLGSGLLKTWYLSNGIQVEARPGSNGPFASLLRNGNRLDIDPFDDCRLYSLPLQQIYASNGLGVRLESVQAASVTVSAFPYTGPSLARCATNSKGGGGTTSPPPLPK